MTQIPEFGPVLRARLSAGELWTINENQYVFKERVGNQLLFASTRDGSLRAVSDGDFLAGCLSKDILPFHPRGENTRRPPVFLLTSEQSEIVERLLGYIRVLDSAPRGQRSGSKLEDRLARFAQKIGDLAPPRPRTVKSWKKKLDAAFGNPQVLAPPSPGEARKRRVSDLVFNTLMKFVTQKYLVRNGPSATAVANDFINKEIPRLRQAYPDLARHYVAPCKTTIRKFIEALDPYLVKAVREGEAAAQAHFRVYGLGPRYERPLQCVQIDTWKKHIVYTDLGGNPLGRLYLAAVIDCYSRFIVGFYIGPEAPRAWTVLQAVRHAMLPKRYVKAQYPEIRNDYPAYGRFELACFDQGPENANLQVPAILGTLGCTTDYGPKGAPHERGVIERWFGTLAEALIHRLPGATGSNVQDKGDYDAVANASLTAAEIIRRVHVWILDEYHNTVHSELGDTPLNVWKRGVAEHGVIPPPAEDELDLLLCQRTTRSIGKQGIAFNRTHYIHPELGMLKGRKPHKAV